MESTNAWVPFLAIGAQLSCVGSISIGSQPPYRLGYALRGERVPGSAGFR